MKRGNNSDRSKLSSAAQYILQSRENSSSSIQRTSVDSNKLSVDILLSDIQQKELTISSLRRNYEGISKALKEEKGNSEEKSKVLKDLENERESLNYKISNFESQNRELSSEIGTLMNELETERKTTEDTGKFKIQNLELSELTDKMHQEIEDKQKALEERSREYERMMRIMRELEGKYHETKGNLSKIERERDETCRKLEKMEQLHESLGNEHSLAAQQIKQFQVNHSSLSAKETYNQNMINTLTKQINEDRQELFTTRNKLRELYNCYQNQGIKLKVAEAQLKAVNSSESGLKRQIVERSQTVGKLPDSAENMSVEKEELYNSYIHTQKENALLKDEVEGLKTDINSCKVQSKDLISLYADKIANLSNRLYQSATENKRVNEEVENLHVKHSTQLTSLEKQLFDKENELEAVISVKQQAISSLQKEIEELNVIVSTLRDSNHDLSETIRVSNTAESELQRELKESTGNNVNLESSLKNAKEVSFHLTGKVNQLEEDLRFHSNELDKRTIEFLQEKEELQGRIHFYQQGESAVPSLQGTINSLEAKNGQLFNEIQTLEERLSEITAETKAYRDSQLRLEQDKLRNSFEVSVLTEKLANSTRKTVKLKHLQHRIKSLTSEKEKLTQDNSQLHSQLKGLKPKKILSTELDTHSGLLKKIEFLRSELEGYNSSELETFKKNKQKVAFSLKKLENALDSLSADLTCNVCFSLLEDSVICTPCNHVVCSSCNSQASAKCPQCSKPFSNRIKLPILDGISGKIIYKQQVLDEAKAVMLL